MVDDSDLPQLNTIDLATHALHCDGDDGRKSSSSAPYNYQNTLTMERRTELDS